MQYDDGDPGEDVSRLEILGIAAPEPRRRRAIAVIVSAAVALVLAGGAAWPLLHEDDSASTLPAPGATGTASASPGGDLGIKGLRTYSHLAADHVVGPVTYPQSPPVGGPHDQVWLACGAYDVPVRKENVVHDLEHGAVWITYQPSLSDSDVAALKKVLPSNGVLSPYPGLSSPVVLTAWGLQLGVDKVDDSRIKAFLSRFGHGEAAPEAGVSCAGGSTDPQGGTAVEDPGTAV
jgi:hypothetical protein